MPCQRNLANSLVGTGPIDWVGFVNSLFHHLVDTGSLLTVLCLAEANAKTDTKLDTCRDRLRGAGGAAGAGSKPRLQGAPSRWPSQLERDLAGDEHCQLGHPEPRIGEGRIVAKRCDWRGTSRNRHRGGRP